MGRTAAGGTTRLAYTEADGEARALLTAWFREAGLDVRTDAAGNLFGVKPGREPGPSVLLGSHIDTVPNAGRFDGCLGVIAALEVAQQLKERAISPKAPIEIVSFAAEESSRFSYAMIGSRAFAGALRPDAGERLQDSKGVTLAEALYGFGLDPTRLYEAQRPPGSIAAYLELHIDQGKVLSRLERPLGLVESIAAAHRLWVEIDGESAHSGAALPEDRKDALAAAAQVILAADRITRDPNYPWTVATVGKLDVGPGAINVIPGHVGFTLDLRGADTDLRDRAMGEIQSLLEDLARQHGFQVRVEELARDQPVPLDPELLRMAEEICRQRNLPCTRVVSLAGHDAMQVARMAPTALLLVRNEGGISHSPGEQISDADLEAALLLYWEMALRQAGVGELEGRATGW